MVFLTFKNQTSPTDLVSQKLLKENWRDSLRANRQSEPSESSGLYNPHESIRTVRRSIAVSDENKN